jgi:hypothetical protein
MTTRHDPEDRRIQRRRFKLYSFQKMCSMTEAECRATGCDMDDSANEETVREVLSALSRKIDLT